MDASSRRSSDLGETEFRRLGEFVPRGEGAEHVGKPTTCSKLPPEDLDSHYGLPTAMSQPS